jgi:nucleoside-diphosphate-sugar epimerase
MHAADVGDLGSLLHVIRAEGITRIVHLAAALGERFDTHPWGSYEVNVGGAMNVLEAARLSGVERAVAASTHDIYPKAYGDYRPPKLLPMSEDHAPDPRRPYPVMKLAAEYMGRYYAEQLGVDYAAIRFSTYYGAERALQRGVKPHDLVSRLIMSAVEGRSLSLDGGDYVFDPIYVKDCAHGVVCAVLGKDPCGGRVFNIGGGRAVSLFQAAETVRRLFPKADISIE